MGGLQIIIIVSALYGFENILTGILDIIESLAITEYLINTYQA